MSDTTPNVDDVMAEMAWWDAVTAAHEVTRLRSALAAARREVETVTREKFAWQQAALNVGEMLGSAGPAGYYEMSAADWRDWALRDLATARAALEDVRRVEAFWSGDINRVDCDWEDDDGTRSLFTAHNGCDIVASAATLEALGRALAQEAGDVQ